MRRAGILVAAGMLLAGACAGGGSHHDRSTGGTSAAAHGARVELPPGTRIVYQAIFGRTTDLGLMGADGSHEHRIPHAPNRNRMHPDVSPDGAWIAFDSNTPSTDVSQIYIVRPDGSGQRRLLPCHAPCYGNGGPSWSPDGSTVLFDAAEGPTPQHRRDLCYLATVDVATGKERRFMKHPGCTLADSYARWSPDGTHVVFDRDRNGKEAVATASIDGSDQRRLTRWGVGARPTWSPDGQWIALMSREECDDCGGHQPPITIMVMRPDGSDLHALTARTPGTRDLHPRWLPDSSGLIFSRCRKAFACALRIVSLDGTGGRLPIDTEPLAVAHPVVIPPPTQ